MCLDLDWSFELNAWGTEMVVVDVVIDADELERKLGEGYLMQ